MCNAAGEHALAHEMLEKRLAQIETEAAFLSSIIFDDQNAAADTWCRVQSVLLLLRYSVAAKLVYFAQTVDPDILEPFARRFDDIIMRTFQNVLEVYGTLRKPSWHPAQVGFRGTPRLADQIVAGPNLCDPCDRGIDHS